MKCVEALTLFHTGWLVTGTLITPASLDVISRSGKNSSSVEQCLADHKGPLQLERQRQINGEVTSKNGMIQAEYVN